MSDFITVLGKELRELVSERHSRRALTIQVTIGVLVLGLVGPRADAAAWANGEALAIVPFAILPGTFAAGIAADAFAGELERKTLETLLATPLSLGALLMAKVATALVVAAVIAAFGLVAAGITLRAVPHAAILVGALGGALTSALVTSSFALMFSIRVPHARAAQQLSALSSLAFSAATAFTWKAAKLRMIWPNVVATELVWLAIGVAGLGAAYALFDRERFFERR